MEREVLRVHISTILEDQHLDDNKKFARLALLARSFLESNKSHHQIEWLFDQWNLTMVEAIEDQEAKEAKVLH